MAVDTTISDLTYRNYDGPMHPPLHRWWVVALSTIKTNIKKPAFWVTFGFIALIYLIYALVFYFTVNVTANMAAMGGGMGSPEQVKEVSEKVAPLKGPSNIYAQFLWLALSQTQFFLFLMTLTVGSGSIAADNQANALLVYLSKPLSRVDYLVGKWVGVFILMASAYMIPPLLLYLFYVAGYYQQGFLRDHPTMLPRLLMASVIAPIVHTSLMIGLSSWSKNGRSAGAIYAGLYIGLNSLAIMLGGLTMRNMRLDEDSMDKINKNSYRTPFTIMNYSISGIGNGLASNLLDTNGVGGLDPPRLKAIHPNPVPLVLIGGVLIAFPLLAASRKIRAVEIIKG
jgi:ABC-2 type transport system permease protein